MKNKKLLFIGANNMGEIHSELHNPARYYDGAIFVEAIPDVYEKLAENIRLYNEKHGTDYRAVNALLTSEEGKKYTFHLFSNACASSSIYDANEEVWWYDGVHKEGEIELVSTTGATLLKDTYPYFHNAKGDSLSCFDLTVDAQGSELEVLKGFGSYLRYVDTLIVEVSVDELYKGGVLFDELNQFLVENDFVLLNESVPRHGDVTYRRRKSYSQYGQDFWVLDTLDNKRSGYFVEAGAADGVRFSNTYLLETMYGWSGICCEPSAEWRDRLSETRRCNLDYGLLYDTSGESETFYQCGLVGGTKSDFESESERLTRRLETDLTGSYQVTTITLNDLLDKYDAPSVIDFISLDTEGSELKILKAFDFSKRDVRCWTVEHNLYHRVDGEQYLSDLIELMSSHGYKHRVVECDVWFWKD